MRAADVIKKKRDGGELSKEEISFLLEGNLKGEVPGYQISAFLMAVYLKGMTDEETVSLTGAMLGTGRRVDLSGVSGAKVDKHSTGGVGDKTSIVLAPILASMGVKVPMLSGRALGHTGGTLDKLESIPGLKTDISQEDFKRNLSEIGFSIMGQTGDTAPADKALYALRDVTATVDCIPLIASSIMSKKLAGGAEGLVLDVKTGSGAFTKDIEDARRLARLMVRIGNSMGMKTVALVTDMDQPLGRTVGNSLEIKECISLLRGNAASDLMELTLALASWMLNVADSVAEETPVMKMSEQTRRGYKHEIMDFIEKGDAFKKFVEFIDAQHGDPEAAFRPNLMPSASNVRAVKSIGEGFVHRLDAEAAGRASVLLGAGRTRAEDPVEHSSGIVINKKVGDYVKAEETVALFHYNEGGFLKEAEEVFLGGLVLGSREPAQRKLIWEIVMP